MNQLELNKNKGMTKTEVKAFNYLIEKRGFSENEIVFQYCKSPDFIIKDRGFEIKTQYNKTIYFSKNQFDKLRNLKNVDILVFDNYNDEAVAIFSSFGLNENKNIYDYKIIVNKKPELDIPKLWHSDKKKITAEFNKVRTLF